MVLCILFAIHNREKDLTVFPANKTINSRKYFKVLQSWLCFISLCNGQQLNFKGERRRRWDDGRITRFTIGQVWRNSQLPFLAHTHALQTVLATQLCVIHKLTPSARDLNGRIGGDYLVKQENRAGYKPCSQPGMTWPCPSLKLKGPRPREESNIVPSCKNPV